MSKVVLYYFGFRLKYIIINNSKSMNNCNFNKCIINNHIGIGHSILCIKTFIQIFIKGTKNTLRNIFFF